MIKPTPGRTVLFVLTSTMPHFAGNAGQRFPALLCQVNDDRNINVCVFDAIGRPFGMENLHLRQPEDASEPGGNHCEWMPYQIGQAVAAAITAIVGPTGGAPFTPQPQPAPIAPLATSVTSAIESVTSAPVAPFKGPAVGQEVYLFRPNLHTMRATITEVQSKSSVSVAYEGADGVMVEIANVAVLPANCGVPNQHVELIATEASATGLRGVPGGTPVAPPTAAPSAKGSPARKPAKKAPAAPPPAPKAAAKKAKRK